MHELSDEIDANTRANISIYPRTPLGSCLRWSDGLEVAISKTDIRELLSNSSLQRKLEPSVVGWREVRWGRERFSNGEIENLSPRVKAEISLYSCLSQCPSVSQCLCVERSWRSFCLLRPDVFPSAQKQNPHSNKWAGVCGIKAWR